MNIEKYIQDGQDAKVVEKIHDKILDMLTGGEYIQYISLQKKPAVTLLPDSITVSNKRIFLSEFTKLGLATNFEIFSWADIKDIAFKEEIFGSKVTVIPLAGENLTIDYIPKIQARKLYQLIKDALEQENKTVIKAPQSRDIASPPTSAMVSKEEISTEAYPVPNHSDKKDEQEPVEPPRVQISSAPDQLQTAPISIEEDDELTLKLRKLKSLYDRQLITQAEYENKKTELLTKL
ncbi:PH domain-containing protein [Sphingobacterium suaedae]|uniref:PH domain-containing protein n=1 Tax=Sphingobacterium suaedae TaxID=1686402 RepID=A0ABW5KJS9_9SPHI